MPKCVQIYNRILYCTKQYLIIVAILMVVSVFMVELVLVIVLSNNYSKKKTVQMA